MLCISVYTCISERGEGEGKGRTECVRINTTVSGNIHYARQAPYAVDPKPITAILHPFHPFQRVACKILWHTIANRLMTSSVLTVRPYITCIATQVTVTVTVTVTNWKGHYLCAAVSIFHGDNAVSESASQRVSSAVPSGQYGICYMHTQRKILQRNVTTASNGNCMDLH
jgi:hypothetical protein